MFAGDCDEPRDGIKGGIDRGLDCRRTEYEDIPDWTDCGLTTSCLDDCDDSGGGAQVSERLESSN